MPTVVVENLVRTFGSTKALDGLSLQIAPGEIRGFLGPNGSGKSTAIRILLGLLRPDSGRATVFGLDSWNDSVRIHRRVAYVAGDLSLWPNLTGGEAIDLLTRRWASPALARRKDELLQRFELDPTKKTRTYSKGNRQKVSLIAALATDAELLLLDEPTSGLDPLMEAVFTDEIRAVKEQGRTVLLSSHILAEVDKLCDSVTIIRAGRQVQSGPLAELRHLTRSTVTATIESDPSTLAAHPDVHGLHVDGSTVTFTIEDSAIAPLLPTLSDMAVENLRISPPSLEEMFLRHYGDAITT